jgi:hypothetical protein
MGHCDGRKVSRQIPEKKGVANKNPIPSFIVLFFGVRKCF